MNAASADDSIRLAQIEHRGQGLRIEYQWLPAEQSAAPLLIFLHEGLGSLAMWRGFPARLCAALGFRGLVYSRPGYGGSTPRPAGQHWTVDFMHVQAREILPLLLAALGLDPQKDPPVLFGHSDGASIALIHAASFPDRVAGVVAAAPHIFVEDLSIASIREARDNYLQGELRQRLAKHHRDVDSAFWGWNDIWLDADFRRWNIEALLPQIRCPVLALQGLDDEYGSMAQIEGIQAAIPSARLLKLPHCGHSPHRDQPDRLLLETVRFLERVERM